MTLRVLGCFSRSILSSVSITGNKRTRVPNVMNPANTASAVLGPLEPRESLALETPEVPRPL